MPPEQSQSPGNQYDFIVSPGGPPKKTILPPLRGQSFTQRLIFIVGGAVILIIIMWIVGTLLSGGGGSTANLTKLVQQEEEIARVSATGAEATRADIRGAALNAQLSLGSQQQAWLQFLASQGTEVSEEQQALLQNATTDQQLEAARANNTFDKTFLDIMRSYLEDYSATLQTTFSSTTNEAERELLRAHFDQTKLLLEQLPKS